jgi:hypothetical protein
VRRKASLEFADERSEVRIGARLIDAPQVRNQGVGDR